MTQKDKWTDEQWSFYHKGKRDTLASFRDMLAEAGLWEAIGERLYADGFVDTWDVSEEAAQIIVAEVRYYLGM